MRLPHGLPEELTAALSPREPGRPLPPGPRMNPWRRAGARPAAGSGEVGELLAAMWRPDGRHRLDDGTLTTIVRRPIPSAGGRYGVHTHIVAGADQACEDPGRYVYDHDIGRMLVRDAATGAAAGWPTPPLPRHGVHLVLSVQPGRSFGRYRHRAWPLWIADVAYALEAIRFLVDADLPAVLGPCAYLRQLVGVPRAADGRAWLARGLVPEIPLAAVELPTGWALSASREQTLARRRSPRVGEFLERSPQGDARGRRLAELSRQAWIAHADHVESWQMILSRPRPVGVALWEAHLSAARLSYQILLSGGGRSRSVSGIPAADGVWPLHAVAILDESGTAEEKTP